MTDTRIAVLRRKIHGLDPNEYVAVLRDRLPNCTIIAARTPDEQREVLQSATVATGLRLPEEYFEDPGDIELFACIFAGTSHLDLVRYEDHGVAVTNAAGVHGPNIGEYVIGSMVALARQFPQAWRHQANANWQSYPTRELYESKVAVIGLGAIGTAILDRLEGFGMETIGVRHTPEKGGPVDTVYGFENIHEAIIDAEYVIVACPLTEETGGLIDGDVLEAMRPDAFLINIARGPVVETDALVSALQRNSIGGAALDVTDPEPLPTDHELWRMENVLITPHNAGNTPAYFERCANILATNVERLDSDEALVNRVV